MRRVLALVMVASVAVAACSGDDDSADPTTTPPEDVSTTSAQPAPTTAPAETTVPPQTTAPPETTAPATVETTPPTSAPDTTAPPTSVDPLEDLAGSIARDAQRGDDALAEVLEDPSRSDAEDVIGSWFSGEALVIALDLLDQFRRNDLIVQPHPTIPRTFGPTGEPTLVDGTDVPTADVPTCRFDSDLVLALVDDSDLRVPIESEIVRVEAISTFVLVDGTWQLDSWMATSETPGGAPCV